MLATTMRSVFLIAVVATLVASCAQSPAPTVPEAVQPTTPSAEATLPAGVSAEVVKQWIAFRQLWGLRSDGEWALAVAQDSTASLEMDVPLLPWELARIVELDQSAQDLVVRLDGYGSRYPDDFAGVFIDGPTVVLRFAHNLDAHRAVITPRFKETGRVRVDEARYSLTELEQLTKQVEARRALVEGLGLAFYSADVDVIGNKVRVRYQGDRRLEEQLRAVLGNPDWLRLENYEV